MFYTYSKEKRKTKRCQVGGELRCVLSSLLQWSVFLVFTQRQQAQDASIRRDLKMTDDDTEASTADVSLLGRGPEMGWDRWEV